MKPITVYEYANKMSADKKQINYSWLSNQGYRKGLAQQSWCWEQWGWHIVEKDEYDEAIYEGNELFQLAMATYKM